jgi:periplasmic copper chaperone A
MSLFLGLRRNRGAVATLIIATAALIETVNLGARQEKQLAATDGWVKLPGPGETQAMAFANFENPTMYVIYLKSAAADVAGKAELRDAALSGDAALKPVDFVTVPAGDWAYMGPKGVHILLMDLKRSLKEGDMVTLTVTTEIGVTLQVPAVVKKE